MVSRDLLVQYPLFESARGSSLDALASMTDERQVRAGEMLFREGTVADRLYILREGAIELRHRSGNGEEVQVERVLPTDLLAWSAVVQPHQATATAVAERDSTLLAVDGQRLNRLCESDPQFGHRFMRQIARTISSRLQAARDRAAERK